VSDEPELLRHQSGAAESGWVVLDNRHLNYLVEFILANVGGCCETEASDRPVKPQQRRSRHSSRRSGKPTAGRRAAGVKRPGVNINLVRHDVVAIPGELKRDTDPVVMPGEESRALESPVR
jgi:hypothetical protein